MSARKILLVDDSTTLLCLEQMVLQSAGYQIVAVKNGEAGVRAALAHRPDLILLEADAETSGICRQLHAHEATRETPILFLTRRGEEENVEEGFPSGGEDFIIKQPIDNNELLAKVKSLLGD